MSGNLFIKICGITNLPDAECAVEAGADALGFIFCPQSPRFLDLESARHLFRKLPQQVNKIGVFVNEPLDLLRQYLNSLPLDYVQLHGDESAAYCAALDKRIIKGLRIKSKDDIKTFSNYRVAYFLLDTFSEGELGGTGKTFDWNLAVEAKKVLSAPVILSGGLNPENVAAAVRLVRPFGVDVSSGVEISPGKKDHKKIKAFIKNAREAGKEIGEQN